MRMKALFWLTIALSIPLGFVLLMTSGARAARPAGDSINLAHELDAESGTTFAEVSMSIGVTGTHTGGGPIPGQAWGDYDGDGWLDLYLTSPLSQNTLFHNNGDGTFSISPYASQVSLPDAVSGGAVFGDYDNDGWDDLYVLNDGPNTLFRNDNGNGFIDVTDTTGVGENGFGQTGSWGDYDADGYLDLYVSNWWCQTANCTNESRDILYHNNGDGTFTNVVSDTLVFAQTDKPTFVASFVDYDNDGDQDIYVVVDKRFRNTLYRNDGPGCGHWCFTDVSVSSGADAEVDGMGLAINDYDFDGDLDFFFSNAGPPVLLQNQTSQGSPTFLDVSVPAGVAFNSISWGTVFFDYNNDSCPDLYLATMDADPARSNRLFHNNCDSTFADVSTGSGADNGGQSFGVAYADYNQDGWLDLVVGNIADRYYVYENQGQVGLGNDWVSFRLEGDAPAIGALGPDTGINRNALGSRVYIELSDGRTLLQEVKSGSSLGSGNDMVLHFGLGTNSIESVHILWSNGYSETLSSVVPNKEWQISYPFADVTLSDGYTLTGLVGETVTFNHLVTNNGNRTDTYSVTADAFSGWVSVNPSTITLAPGETGSVDVELILPALPQDDIVDVTATSGNNPAVSHTVTDYAEVYSSLFTDVSASVGITASHNFAAYFITGQAWGDYNKDGWLDLYVTDTGGPNTLFVSDGDGTFSVSPHANQLALPDIASGGALWADYNNDGWRDLYVTNFGANSLFRNDAGQGFTDVSASAGVDDIGAGAMAAWGDFDEDGWLDLYVVNHAPCAVPGGDGCPPRDWDDILYHNNGDGTFTDVTSSLVTGFEGPGLAGSWLDYDNDGDLDFYLVNDKMNGGTGPSPGSNIMYRNDGPGCEPLFWCFSEVSEETNTDTQVDGMGIGVGDYDNDQDLDLYFSDSGPARLLQNQMNLGLETYSDVTVPAGIYFEVTSWGAIMFDYDHDGWLDLYLATVGSTVEQGNRLWHNLGYAFPGMVTFEDVSDVSGALAPGFSLGVAYADYDNDGWVDIIVGNRDEEGFQLLRNNGVHGANYDWLTIQLEGGGPINLDAIGARVYLYLDDGRTLMQEVKSGSSFGSGNDLALYFGLGEANITMAEVLWPDGTLEVFTDVPVNEVWQVTYPLSVYYQYMPVVGKE